MVTHIKRTPNRSDLIFNKVIAFIKSNTVLCIAACAALITSVVVPPDSAYIDYLDLKTLTCLFCTLAVICALKEINFFTIIAQKVVSLTGDIRRAIIAIVIITFAGSMIIANDMALITFLPIGYYVLKSSGQQKYMIFTFVMQNIGANLGGMLTPFGNPQNLYLYNKFDIPGVEFLKIMVIPFVSAIFLILLCCFIFVRPGKITICDDTSKLPTKKTVIYLLLFALSIVIVFRVIPYYIGLIVIPAVLFFLDRKALIRVDYGLLLTFVCFFIFSGNMSRIDAVNAFISALLEKHTLLFSALSCQVISNVPSAILLSAFTDNYRALLYGVNIGSAGTLVASLASLITFRQYSELNPGGVRKYLLWFTVFNAAFFVVMLAICAMLL